MLLDADLGKNFSIVMEKPHFPYIVPSLHTIPHTAPKSRPD